MATKTTKTKENNKFILLVFLILLILGVIAPNFLYLNKIFPGIYVAGLYVGGSDRNSALAKLEKDINISKSITLFKEDEKFEIPTDAIKFKYDFLKTIDKAIKYPNRSDIYPQLLNLVLVTKAKPNIKLVYEVDDDILSEYLSVVASRFSIEPVYPTISLVNNKVKLTKGAAGKEVNIKTLKEKIDSNLSSGISPNIEIPIQDINPTLTSEQEKNFISSATSLIDKSITFNLEGSTKTLYSSDLIKFLSPYNKFDTERIDIYINEIGNTYNRDAQNSVFNFRDGRVVEFKASLSGIRVSSVKLKDKILDSLNILISTNEKAVTIDIPYSETPPEITNEEVNNLGIKELIGKGDSKYKGSIQSRIYNVGLASSKLNGVLIKPDEVFSFNNTLGDVSALTGYKQAYIIKDGKTILGDGGGVCQVSTTLFRAVLAAGLPVVERSAHSYRVSYYEQGSPPGIDATVFAPTTDFKFKNDTGQYLLIQTIYDPKTLTLVFEIYGTSDGRTSTVSKPIVSNVTPPPEDLYTDDPSLPNGVIKQVDYKAWGAKVVFNYQVTRDNQVIYEKTFVSNYRPWQAKFLKGTGN